MRLDNESAKMLYGGISGTMINAIARVVKTIYDIGYSFGSGLRRMFAKTKCK